MKTLRSYLFAWFRGADTISAKRGFTFSLLPIRMIIAVALLVAGVLLGNRFGFPRLSAGLGIGIAFVWILLAAGKGNKWLSLAGLALTGLWIYWKVYRELAGAPLSLVDVVFPFVAFLFVLDALGAYGEMRWALDHLDYFCPVCGRALSSRDVAQDSDYNYGGGRVARTRSYVTQKTCACGYRAS